MCIFFQVQRLKSGVTEGLTKMIKPTNYYPFFIFLVGTNDATQSLKAISTVYDQLGRIAKELRAQVVISFVFPTEGQHPLRKQRI